MDTALSLLILYNESMLMCYDGSDDVCKGWSCIVEEGVTVSQISSG